MTAIYAGTTATNAYGVNGDTSGNLVLQTNGTTTALTLTYAQNAILAGNLTASGTIATSSNIFITPISPRQALVIGSNATSTSTTSPNAIDIGSTYSAVAGQNPKTYLWNNSTNYIGLGVSSNSLDYIVNDSGSTVFAHNWYTNIASSATPVNSMKLSPQGYLTTPYQVAFSAKHNATESLGANGTFVAWTVSTNTYTAGWSSGTGVYTVPVAGKYLIMFSILRNTGGAASGVWFVWNGSNYLRLNYADSAGSTGYVPLSGQIILTAAASDTFKFTSEQATSWYGDTAGVGAMNIYLLG
jgi:hypothetical protein